MIYGETIGNYDFLRSRTSAVLIFIIGEKHDLRLLLLVICNFIRNKSDLRLVIVKDDEILEKKYSKTRRISTTIPQMSKIATYLSQFVTCPPERVGSN